VGLNFRPFFLGGGGGLFVVLWGLGVRVVSVSGFVEGGGA